MKGRNLILTGLVAALIGFALIFFRHELADGGVVVVAGIIFLAAGILNTTVFLASRDKKGEARMGAVGTAIGWVASAAAVVLGLAMLIFSKAFVAIVGFMFAVLLLFAALFQLFLLIFGSRPTRLSGLFYLLPAGLVGAAIYIFLRKPDTVGEQTVMLVTGISLLVFGLFTIIEGSLVGRTNHAMRKAARTPAPATPEKAQEKAEQTGADETADEHDKI